MSWKKEKEEISREIIEMLYDVGIIRTWYCDKPEGWTLHSGLWSPVYINLRPLASFPEILKKVGLALGRLLKEDCKSVTRVVGIATAGVPISAAITLETGYPSGYTRKIEGVKSAEEFRKKISEYGQHSMIEGVFEDGDDVILVDDLVTRLTSKLIAVEQFRVEMKRRNVKAKSDKLLVLLDREQGAEKMAQENGLKLFSLIPFKTKGIGWLKEKISGIEYKVLSDYLENTEKYQDKELQEELKKQATL
ncbi:MAG: orotate phosphoribosyltransferase [Promethearchaeota archaeon]